MLCQEEWSRRQLNMIILTLEPPINFALSPRKH